MEPKIVKMGNLVFQEMIPMIAVLNEKNEINMLLGEECETIIKKEGWLAIKVQSLQELATIMVTRKSSNGNK